MYADQPMSDTMNSSDWSVRKDTVEFAFRACSQVYNILKFRIRKQFVECLRYRIYWSEDVEIEDLTLYAFSKFPVLLSVTTQ